MRIAILGVVVLIGGFLLSGWLSQDRDRAHSKATQALPLYAAGVERGLVRVPARGLEFRARVAGLGQEGPAVLMLHGFPESSMMWEPMLAAAAKAGFRAAAFDQRGYSPGARFDAPSAYGIEELTADALAVADELGFERFHLVGHDWGSVVGWKLAAEEPARVITWTSLSIPHLAGVAQASAEAGAGTPLYIRAFRVPGLMESVFAFGGFSLLDRMMAEVPEPQRAEYRALLSEPGGMKAALDWYRAMNPVGLEIGPVAVPVLYVFGNRDLPVFVGPAPRKAQEAWLTGPFRSVELDAGHWLLEQEPERVVGEVMAHLQANRGL